MVFGNQNFYSIIFREEIEALKNRYIGRLQVFHILSRERMESDINYGRIDGPKCDWAGPGTGTDDTEAIQRAIDATYGDDVKGGDVVVSGACRFTQPL